VAGWYELRKDGRELLGHLLERPLDGLILGLIEMLDQLLDGRLRRVKLLASLQ